MRDRKKRNIIIGSLCCLLVFMGIGYAILSQTLNISGTANMQGNWSVKITNMKLLEANKTGRAENVSNTFTDTTASFEANLWMPGDSIEYEVTVENQGNIDAVLKDIIQTKTNKDKNLKFSNSLIGTEVLTSGSKMSFTMKVEIPEEAETLPEVKESKYEIQLIYIQYNGGEYTPPAQSIGTLAERILADNTALPDTNIDFSQISSDTNGKGLYYTNKNTEDNKTTYYFRGDVTNNYVKFADIIWRAVRINEDGSVRLVTEESVGESAYNHYGYNEAVGYMYGTEDSSTYEETHKNTKDSAIKKYVDNWYKTNLNDYTAYMSTTAGFCNDRSVAPTAKTWSSSDTALGYGTNETYYGTYNRLENTKQPQFACPQTNDLFTMSTSSKGNKALTYPVGLLTFDEVIYAGGKRDKVDINYYLNNKNNYWTMSPLYGHFSVGDFSYFIAIGDDSNVYGWSASSRQAGTRPVINLSSDVETISGDGTKDSPYVVK